MLSILNKPNVVDWLIFKHTKSIILYKKCFYKASTNMTKIILIYKLLLIGTY